MLYASGVELCPTMHMGYVNFEVKHLVSLHFYSTHNFCIESSNDVIFFGGKRLLDFKTFLRPTKLQKVNLLCTNDLRKTVMNAFFFFYLYTAAMICPYLLHRVFK